MKLTKPQLKIVNTRECRIIVVAGPGTGKTEVLAHYTAGRAKTLTSKWPIKPENAMPPILLFTHTNNAKDTMDERLNEITSNQNVLNSILCITFHSFALRMINRYGRQSYDVDDNCNERILNELIEHSRVQHTLTTELTEQIPSVYEDHVGMGLSIKRILKRHYPHLLKYRSEITNAIEQLERNKKKLGLVTLTDLPTAFVKLLNQRVIPDTVLHRFQVVVVDEFQDTLTAQWEIIKGLAGPDTRLLVAGDPNQTIFTWAGASYKRFDEFREAFPGNFEYHLTINHRSTDQIIKISKGILKQSRYSSNVKNESEIKGVRPSVVCNPDRAKLCEYISEEIQRLHKLGKPLDKIAVVYRFHRDRHLLIPYLVHRGIPYRVYEQRKRRERPAIRLIFAFIHVVGNRGPRGHSFNFWNEWKSILTNLEGVGSKQADRIVEWLKIKKPNEYTYPKELKFKVPLRELLKDIQRVKSPTKDGPDRLEAIVDIIYQMPKVNKTLMDAELATLFYLAHKFNSLSEVIRKYEDPSYPTYYPAGSTMPPFPDSYLTLSTIHKIKGSEYDYVFYLGTDDFTFRKWNLFKGNNKQHELLLMNVACSRARRKLVMLFPVDPNLLVSRKSSPNPWTFIKKIPLKHYKFKTL